jgi:predicted nucleic acid-binding protein
VIVVLDASVILKWLLEDPAREPDTEKALAVIESENEDALLVTADERYHMKAERYGMIAALRDWGK